MAPRRDRRNGSPPALGSDLEAHLEPNGAAADGAGRRTDRIAEAMHYHFRDLPTYADELLARVSG